jgi:hypothetical protein
MQDTYDRLNFAQILQGPVLQNCIQEEGEGSLNFNLISLTGMMIAPRGVETLRGSSFMDQKFSTVVGRLACLILSSLADVDCLSAV